MGAHGRSRSPLLGLAMLVVGTLYVLAAGRMRRATITRVGEVDLGGRGIRRRRP